ncbi:glutamate-rich protein 5 isoform X2 [Nomascus leucogenys]|uniref:Glutamate rich 5 n=1 Tax=Nomascus leucogenys TaxID=61853 RepID=A0A2I3G6P3_NOMLE|nr:glutamate-rich protein 5 isoform X2 [Nomascus leucogenys]XP_032616001.1 glutamate-rich protein 5 isoform X2 [Hylobates moloch]XP_055142839.1 glutamate-rich protein 5 isoform X2 [Symphalangus syndactylus]
MGCSSSALNKAGDSSRFPSGETGEKVATEMENEKVSEGAETKEEETGEAVDLSAAT